MKAILSIHDVMPDTLTQVAGIIEQLPQKALSKTTLLVVPGLNWNPEGIQQLRSWQDQGLILAGHGWIHHCASIKGCYHRLHSLLISRRAAEHLSQSREQLQQLLERNHRWFLQHQLSAPNFYVPPAWAMGKLSKGDLSLSAFDLFETTSGVYSTQQNKSWRLPLVGYEADTRLRALALSVWNALNKAMSSATKPLRISIHPFDLQYFLKDDIAKHLGQVDQFISYQEFVQN